MGGYTIVCIDMLMQHVIVHTITQKLNYHLYFNPLINN